MPWHHCRDRMICVDKIFTAVPRTEKARRLGTRWSHMWHSEHDINALVAFAVRIGMKPHWLQNDSVLPHFDLVPSKRAMAIKLGAVETDVREAVEARLGNRKAQRQPGGDTGSGSRFGGHRQDDGPRVAERLL